MKAQPAAAPVNDKCPVSGADVDAAVTSAFGGHVVAFCCNNCKGKAEKAEGDAQVELVFNDKSFEKGFAPKKSNDS